MRGPTDGCEPGVRENKLAVIITALSNPTAHPKMFFGLMTGNEFVSN